MIVKQSTAASVTLGPILDADGVAKTDEVVASILASKNGGAPSALDGSATLTHRHTGNYTLTYTANDSDTVGTLEFTLSSTTNAMPIKSVQVVEEAIHAQLFASGADAKTGYKLASDGADLVLVDGKTLPAALQIIAASAAGKITDAGEDTETFLGLDGVTPRVTATVDEDGNRSVVVYG